jgi:hypothetical protein
MTSDKKTFRSSEGFFIEAYGLHVSSVFAADIVKGVGDLTQ